MFIHHARITPRNITAIVKPTFPYTTTTKFFFSTDATSIKALREATGAGLADCKAALVKTGGDTTKAMEILKDKGRAVAQAKSSRTANAGLVCCIVSNDHRCGAIAKANTETDFVARNDVFQKRLHQITEQVLNGEVISKEPFVDVAGQIRENIVLREYFRIESPSTLPSSVGCYVHNMLGPNMGTIAALVLVDGVSPVAAQKVAQHIVAANPTYIDHADVPKDVLEAQKTLAMADPAVAGKPDKIREKIIGNKLAKYLAEVCLMEQSFLLGEDEGKSIKSYLGPGAKVVAMHRLQIK